MKNRRTIYFLIILFLCIIYTGFSEFYGGKITDRTNIASAPEVSNANEIITEKPYESKVTKCTIIPVSSKQAVTMHSVSVTPPVTTSVIITTEAFTVVSEENPVTQPEVTQMHIDNNNNLPSENPPQEQVPSEPQPVPHEPSPEPEQGGQYAPSATEFQSEVLRIVNSYRREEDNKSGCPDTCRRNKRDLFTFKT